MSYFGHIFAHTDHVSHTTENAHNVPVNQVSCSHIKNFLRNWPKIYKIPIFTYFFKLKIPEKIRSKYQNSTSTTFWAILLCTLLQPSSLEERVECVKAWKEGLESKGLHVNMTKTQFMASGLGLDILQDSGKFPCAVCRTGVGRSSIRCSKCNLWVHYKKCSASKHSQRTCPMNALVAVVRRVYALSTAALSRRLRLVTVCSKQLIVSATWVTCSVLVVAVWLLPLLDASVPGESFSRKPSFAHVQACAFRPEGSSV